MNGTCPRTPGWGDTSAPRGRGHSASLSWWGKLSPMPDMALMDLYRENHVGVDRNVPAYLWIDNVPRGRVLPGDTLQTELEPGQHRLEVKADDAKAKPLVVDVEPGAGIQLVLTLPDRLGVAELSRVCKSGSHAADSNPLTLQNGG
jgi:hypothetical protein